jgi:hypothetical protein
MSLQKIRKTTVMTPLTQRIIEDRNQIFQADTRALRAELNASDEKTHKAFLTAVSEAQWIKELPLNKKQLLFDKVMLVAPSCTIPNYMQLWMGFIQPVCEKQDLKDFPFKREYFIENRLHIINLSWLGEARQAPDYENLKEEDVLLYFVKACLNDNLIPPWEAIQAGVSLDFKIRGEDLLDIVVRKSKDCQLIGNVLKLYQDFLPPEEYAEREKAVKKILLQKACDRAAKLSSYLKSDYTPEEHQLLDVSLFGEVWESFSFLDQTSPAFRRNQLQAHPLYYVMAAALSGNEKELKDLLSGENKVPVSTYFRRREAKHLTALEAGFVMLNRPHIAKLFVSETQGKEVHVSASDRLYRTYDFKKQSEALSHRYKNLKKTLSTAEKWSDKTVLKECNDYMKRAFLHTVYIFREVQERSKGDPIEMARLLSDRENENYLDLFLRKRSFVSFYHLARNNGYRAPELLSWHYSKMTPEMERPFFDPSDCRYQWRVLYTFISAWLRAHDFKGSLDWYFSSWTKWDLTPQIKKES